MSSSRKIFVALSFALSLAACASHPANNEEAQTSTPAEGNREPASFSGARKAADDKCFVEYSQAAGRCNQSAGEDDVAFSTCLKPVKTHLQVCCVKNGGSAKCAEEAQPASHIVHKSADNKCNGDYDHEIARCKRASTGKELSACVSSVDEELKSCCKQFNGTKKCAAQASAPASANQKAIDDACFMDYIQNLNQCTPASGSDNEIGECVKPLQYAYKMCCKDKGGSADCAAYTR